MAVKEKDRQTKDFEVDTDAPAKVQEAARAARRSLREGRKRYEQMSDPEKEQFRKMQDRLFQKMNAGLEEK